MTTLLEAPTARGSVRTGPRAVAVSGGPSVTRWPVGVVPSERLQPSGFASGLAAVSVVAAVLRCTALNGQGFGSDEAVYAQQGHAMLHALLTGAPDPQWPAVRAHPPLLGLLVAAVPGSEGDDLRPRLVAVVFGVLTVVLTGLLGRRVAGRAAGLTAAFVVAVLPYHVDVSRLVLVDGPMAAAAAAGLLLTVRWLDGRRVRDLVGSAVAFATATLFKETALLTAAAVVAVVVVELRRTERRAAVLAAGAGTLVLASYPLVAQLSGAAGTVGAYVGWQVARPAAADAGFYPSTVLPRFGLLVLCTAAVGAVLLVGGRTVVPTLGRAPQARDRSVAMLVLGSVLVPAAFYAVWPTRGYPYLTALVPPVAVLASVAAMWVLGPVLRAAWTTRAPRTAVALAALFAAAVTGAAVPATAAATPPAVPAASGVPGLREAARELAAQRADDVLVASATTANVVRYYAPGIRVRSLAEPTRADLVNPAYRPVPGDSGPTGRTAGPGTYLLWDSWTAATDPQASDRLLSLARVSHARVADVRTAGGSGMAGRTGVVVVTFEVTS